MLSGADAELILHRLIELFHVADESLYADSPRLIEVLVGSIVESSTVDRLSDAERLCVSWRTWRIAARPSGSHWL